VLADQPSPDVLSAVVRYHLQAGGIQRRFAPTLTAIGEEVRSGPLRENSDGGSAVPAPFVQSWYKRGGESVQVLLPVLVLCLRSPGHMSFASHPSSSVTFVPICSALLCSALRCPALPSRCMRAAARCSSSFSAPSLKLAELHG